MRRVVLEVGEDGRIVVPEGTRVRVMGEVLNAEESAVAGSERGEGLARLFEEIDARLDPLPRKPWPENDPIVEKYRRMGVLEED